MALFQSDSNRIGLDIGTTGLRLVQVRGSDHKLVTYGSVPVESKVVQSDAEVDRQQIVAAVKKLLGDSKVTSKTVVAGLPSAKVFSSLINLPKMSVGELEKSVRYQAEQHVPMALNQVKLDWMVVGETADGKQQEVLIVAAPISLAERYLSILEGSGLEVAALEPDAFALARALVSANDVAAVALDVGASATDLVTVHNSFPKLIRSIPVGGDTFVKAAAQMLNLETEQAFQFVYKFGLAQGKLEGQVHKAIKSSIDSLVSELDKSIKFFVGRYKDVKINKVILTGKASLVPEFPAYLANSVNLPVEIGNSWAHIATPTDLQQQLMELSNQFAVACGLAIREAR
ncbi:type IV pilus assembly protein PilM [Candidatus Microgenomates bacterium]|nr:type IV pilus assembly protein PilM [Candidatus Microgenomates bacterium]